MGAAKKVGIGLAGAIAIAVPVTAQFEGLWLTAKVDTIGTGKPVTWCYGETEGPVKVGQRFTKKQCDDMLAAKLPRYAEEIAKCIKVDISDKTRAAFISFAYNVGSAGFCRSTAARKLNAGDVRGACDALMAWNRAQGRVVKGLTNRRTTERKMCLEGIGEKPTPPQVQQAAAQVKPWWKFWRAA